MSARTHAAEAGCAWASNEGGHRLLREKWRWGVCRKECEVELIRGGTGARGAKGSPSRHAVSSSDGILHGGWSGFHDHAVPGVMLLRAAAGTKCLATPGKRSQSTIGFQYASDWFFQRPTERSICRRSTGGFDFVWRQSSVLQRSWGGGEQLLKQMYENVPFESGRRGKRALVGRRCRMVVIADF